MFDAPHIFIFLFLLSTAAAYSGVYYPVDPPCPLGYNCNLAESNYTTIRVTNPETAKSTREAIISYVWKNQNFPTRFPDEV